MPDEMDTDDPALWSVNRVIHELCRGKTSDWMGSGLTMPVPRAPDVEQAFRDNDIDGDELLQLNSTDFQAMEFKSIGQLNKLKRIVIFLRTRSARYSAQMERYPSMTLIPTVEPTPSVPRQSHEVSISDAAHPSLPIVEMQDSLPDKTHSSPRFDTSSNVIPSSQLEAATRKSSNHKKQNEQNEHTMLDMLDRAINAQQKQEDRGGLVMDQTPIPRNPKRLGDFASPSDPKRRRVQPSPDNPKPELHQFGRSMFNLSPTQTEVDSGKQQDFDPLELESASAHTGPTSELPDLQDDKAQYFDRLLEMYPVQDEDDDNILPIYGESEEEDREMTEEESSSENEHDKKHADDPSCMTNDQKNEVIEECIVTFLEDWKVRKQDLVQKRAHKKWKATADRPDIREAIIQAMKKEFVHIRERLTRLREAIIITQFSKADDVRKQCESLQVSIHQCEENSLYIRALSSQEEPICPALDPVKRPKPRQSSMSNEDIICESEEEHLSDFISSDEVSDEDEDQHDVTALEPHDLMEQDLDSYDHPIELERATVVEDHNSRAPDDFASSSEDVNMTVSRQPVPTSSVPPRRYTVDDWYCGDADDEDGEVIPPSSQQGSANKQRAAEGKIRNPLVLPESDDSSDSRRPSHRLSQSPLATKGKRRRGGRTKDKAIILTSSSSQSEGVVDDNDFEIHTPELNPADPEKKVPKTELLSGPTARPSASQNEIVVPSLTKVAAIPWKHVINDPENNQILALAKAVSETHEQDASILLQYVRNLSSLNMEDNLQEGLVALRSDTETNIIGVPKHKQDTVLLLTLLYISYVLIRRFAEDEYLDDWEGDCAWNSIDAEASNFQRALVDLLRQRVRLAQDSVPMPAQIVVEDSSIENDSMDTGSELTDSRLPRGSAKRRKGRKNSDDRKAVSEANMVLDTQRMAKRRVADQEARKAVINHRLAQISSQTDEQQIPVNFKEPLVMLDQHIAGRIKPHQITGVQFIWRELIEDTQQQGCLLAHTMGLGKTMQVISTLVTIAQCVRSSDPEIRAHIPSNLHELRILILSPPALCENWFDELLHWMPKHDTLGPICKITNRSKQPYYDIKQWSESGGVLLLGYDRLVSYTKIPTKTASETIDQHARKLKQHEDMSRWLFDLPTIVIADEAHMLKNPTAKRADTAMKIKTMSRVALTGSPLSNHLEEYWAMINFIAPGYLGEISKFRQKFVEPINRCLIKESGTFDRRLGLRKMHVLKKIVDPKVNRADITAIQGDLPSKTEFFVTVPLTALQLEMYKICVTFFRGLSADDVIGKGRVASLLQWISVLSLLCNHPWTFEQKLRDPERKKRHQKSLAEDADDFVEDDIGIAEIGAEDVDIAGQPAMLEAMRLALRAHTNPAMQEGTGIEDPALSNRMVLVKAIIGESLELNEKILIFSHSLLTLDYMELILHDLKCPFGRIDGGLATDKRQKVSKDFNAGTSKTKAFLISTRAGGLGLNLYGATRVIILDYSFNPSWEEQAIGRAYRLGQKKPVFVYRFKSGGTFEDVTFNQTIFKTQLFTRIIDHKAVLRKGSKVEAGRYLVDPSIPELKDFSESSGKDPQIMDKIIQQYDCIRDIVLTETFAQDIDEGLTAIEIEEANQEFEDERLAREDPDAYQRRLAARTAEQYRLAQTRPTATLPQRQPSTVFQQLHNALFSSSAPNPTWAPHERPPMPHSSPAGRSSFTDETGNITYGGTHHN